MLTIYIYIYIYISFIYELIKVNIKSIRITKNDSICLTGRISISLTKSLTVDKDFEEMETHPVK